MSAKQSYSWLIATGLLFNLCGCSGDNRPLPPSVLTKSNGDQTPEVFQGANNPPQDRGDGNAADAGDDDDDGVDIFNGGGGGGGGGGVINNDPLALFSNPVVESGADPTVVQKDGFYYYCFTAGDSFFVSKSARLHEIGKVTPVRVFQAPPGQPFSSTIFGPTLQFVDGRWYIYFSADDGRFDNHRTFVLEGDSVDPQAPFAFKAQMAAFNDRFSVNGSVLDIGNGKRYFLWSGSDNFNLDQQNLYIAPMVTPFSLNPRPAFVQKVEAEAAVITEARIVNKGGSSGGASVGFIDFANSSVEFTITAPAAGVFALDIAHSRGIAGNTNHDLFVNGTPIEKVAYPIGDSFDRVLTVTRRVTLRAGENKIKLQKSEGFAELDYIEVKTPDVDRVAIAHAELEFERKAGAPYINEGPSILQRGGKTFIVYSANAGAIEDRSLGLLELVGTDPMLKESWKKASNSVFSKTGEVFAPSNAVFVKSPDLSEDWMVYHHQKTRGSGFDRQVSIQRFSFRFDGLPSFSSPISTNQRLPIPSE